MGHQSWQKLTLTYFGKENQIICTANFLQIWDPFQIKKNKIIKFRNAGQLAQSLQHICVMKKGID